MTKTARRLPRTAGKLRRKLPAVIAALLILAVVGSTLAGALSF